jgi:hypothetical protein
MTPMVMVVMVTMMVVMVTVGDRDQSKRVGMERGGEDRPENKTQTL